MPETAPPLNFTHISVEGYLSYKNGQVGIRYKSWAAATTHKVCKLWSTQHSNTVGGVITRHDLHCGVVELTLRRKKGF